MKLPADELPTRGSGMRRTFIGERFSDDSLDLVAIEREIELAIELTLDGPWKFTDPFDEPE